MMVRAAILAGFLALGGAALADTPPVAPSATSVDGFRSATFGMDMAAVKAAAAADLHVAASQMQTTTDPRTLTPELVVAAPQVMDGLGKAQVTYVFGYKSQVLDQVQVAWATAADKANDAKALLTAASQLQGYFEAEGFAPGAVVTNRVLGDGTVVVLRAQDGSGHLVVEVLRGQMVRDGANKVLFTPAALVLGYFADPAHPDVFALPKGAF
jgi:hypothetical protein